MKDSQSSVYRGGVSMTSSEWKRWPLSACITGSRWVYSRCSSFCSCLRIALCNGSTLRLLLTSVVLVDTERAVEAGDDGYVERVGGDTSDV